MPAAIATAIISAVLAFYSTQQDSHAHHVRYHHPKAISAAVSTQLFTVEHAVDGDTLALSNGERVRLIGVDTPESAVNPKLYRDAKRSGRNAKTILSTGAQAKLFTKKLCEGRKVRLETDTVLRDKYGRILAYVFLDDQTFVNAELVRSGYAHVYTISPNVKYKDYFLGLEREARENRKGFWGKG